MTLTRRPFWALVDGIDPFGQRKRIESNRIEPKRNQNKTLPRPQISSICLSNSSDVTNVSISKKESYASILNEQHTLSVESIQRFLFICQVFLGGTNISKVFQEVSVTFPCLPPSDMLMWPADTDSKKALARSTSIYHLPYHLNGGAAVSTALSLVLANIEYMNSEISVARIWLTCLF